MKKALKFLFVAALIALMMVCAVACGGNGDSNATPTPAPNSNDSSAGGNFTKPGETYSFTSWQYTSTNPYADDDERSQAMRERVEAIQTSYGITVEFVPGSSQGAMLQSAFQGMPEITGQKEGGLHTMMNTYLYQGNAGVCLTALSDHSDVYNLKDENKFNVYSQYDLCEYNDKLWFFIPWEIGIHFECGGNALVFNKKLIEAAGSSAEQIYAWVDEGTWTWDKFETLLSATTIQAKGQYGIERGNEALVMWSLANSNGTEFVRKETLPNGQIQDTFVYSGDKGDRLMRAYDEFIKFKNQGWMEPTYYSTGAKEPLEHFLAGQVAFFYNGYSTNPLKEIAKAEFDYGIVPWPKGPDNVANENKYYSFFPHMNPYCVFRDTEGNVKGAVQILCELYTPIYDKDSQEAIDLYEDEKMQFGRDQDSRDNIDIIENNKEHFRVFMYSFAPVSLGNANRVCDALFGKGEDDILNQTQSAQTYFSGIAGAINNAIEIRSPYSWK